MSYITVNFYIKTKELNAPNFN